MKISDKIREWCNDAYSGRKIRTTKDLYAIADLIDREMVELPRDKDGVPIHVGDLVYLDDLRRACVTEIDIKDACVSIDCWERIADDLYEVVDAADDMCEMLANFADRIRMLAAKEDRQCQ